ncbi:MAG: alcohol dehydrogenase catalytic domain-containing protein [Actinomycetota bacterium]
MKRAVLTAPESCQIVEEPVPEIGPEEVLLRVAACGVCTSELDMYRGLAGGAGHATYPWEPGHEISGVVEKVGDRVQTFSVGDPVVAWIPMRGYAEYVGVKAEFCLPAAGVPLHLAMAEPLACAVNAVELAAPSLGDDIVLIGAGFMGILIQKLVMLRGPHRLVVADTRDDALERAASLGATRTVNVLRESLPDVVGELTEARGADVAFEATGVQAALDVLGEVTRMSGTVVIAGYHQGPPRTLPLGDWNWMAFRIVNAHFRELTTIMRGMGIGMRLLTSGRLSMDGLVTHRFPLEEIDRAFRTAIDKPPGFVKATVEP